MVEGNAFGIIMGILGTVIPLFIIISWCPDDAQYGYQPPEEVYTPAVDINFGDVCMIIGVALFWWSFPGAWFRGMIFDPTCTVFGVMAFIPYKIISVFADEPSKG